MKIYLAGLLFSEAGQRWLRGLKAELAEHDYKVIWQYELFNQDEIPSWGDDASKK